MLDVPIFERILHYGNKDWCCVTNTWNENMFAPLDAHMFPCGLPSHVTLGLCPHIPSYYLSRGGCRFLLLYWVVALMEWLLRLIRAFVCLGKSSCTSE